MIPKSRTAALRWSLRSKGFVVIVLVCVSSKQEVTDVSGRGVGLGAVRVACAALRGRVVVESAPGEGTTFAFAFPVESLGDAYTRLCSAVA